MAYEKRKHSLDQVEKAGVILSTQMSFSSEGNTPYELALPVFWNFRAAHSYLLRVFYMTHEATGQCGQAVLRLRSILVGSHADTANPEFAGKTGNGDWADCLAEMDHRTGQILDAIKEAGIEDNTLVVFTSDNGPEATNPWQGHSGPWRGTYFTAMEGSLRAPFIIRWPGKVPAGRVTNEIVHIVDLYTTLAHFAGADVPKDRPIDGVDQSDFLLGKQETSNREGFPAYVADRLSAVKWRNWKAHLIWQGPCTPRHRSFRCLRSSTCSPISRRSATPPPTTVGLPSPWRRSSVSWKPASRGFLRSRRARPILTRQER